LLDVEIDGFAGEFYINDSCEWISSMGDSSSHKLDQNLGRSVSDLREKKIFATIVVSLNLSSFISSHSFISAIHNEIGGILRNRDSS